MQVLTQESDICKGQCPIDATDNTICASTNKDCKKNVDAKGMKKENKNGRP